MTFSAVVFRDEDRGAEIAQFFSASNCVNVLAYFSTSKSSWSTEIVRLAPQLIVVDLGSTPVRSLSLVATVKKAFPDKAFLVTSKIMSQELVRTAYRLGAFDVIDSNAFTTELPVAVALCQKRLSAGARLPLPKKSSYDVVLVSDALAERCQQITGLLKSKKQVKHVGTTDIKSALEQARQLRPDIVWIELSPDPEKALALISILKQDSSSHSAILVSHEEADVSLIRQAYRLGAFDYLDSPRWKTDLSAVLQSLMLNSFTPASISSDGSSSPASSLRVVAFVVVLLSVVLSFLLSQHH